MRTQTWLSMFVVALTLSLTGAAWACPLGANAHVRTGPSAQLSGDLHHLSQWHGPHGSRWTISARATHCADLDLAQLARMGGVDALDCERVAPRAVTVLVPQQLAGHGLARRDWLPGAGSLEATLPASLPVSVVIYDTDTRTLREVARRVTPAQADSVVRMNGAGVAWRTLELERHARQPLVDWLARGTVALDASGPQQSIIMLAPIMQGPQGVAQVERALQLMPEAQYTVINLAGDETRQAATPQLSGISDAAYLTRTVDAHSLRRVVLERFTLESSTPARDASLSAAPERAADGTRATRCGFSREGAAYTLFVVALVLWYVFGLKLAMFLMLRSRSKASPAPGPRHRRRSRCRHRCARR